MQTVSNTNTNTKKKKKKNTHTQHKTKATTVALSTINISHILITTHGFKVYRTKTLCRKNKHIRERETESNNWFEILSLRIGRETIK